MERWRERDREMKRRRMERWRERSREMERRRMEKNRRRWAKAAAASAARRHSRAAATAQVPTGSTALPQQPAQMDFSSKAFYTQSFGSIEQKTQLTVRSSLFQLHVGDGY